MLAFLYFILTSILSLLVIALILSAVISWLVAFDVINLRNRYVNQFARFLDAVTTPILAPFRRFVPPLGGVDITPILAILVLQGAKFYLLPWIFGLLGGLGGGVI